MREYEPLRRYVVATHPMLRNAETWPVRKARMGPRRYSIMFEHPSGTIEIQGRTKDYRAWAVDVSGGAGEAGR